MKLEKNLNRKKLIDIIPCRLLNSFTFATVVNAFDIDISRQKSQTNNLQYTEELEKNFKTLYLFNRYYFENVEVKNITTIMVDNEKNIQFNIICKKYDIIIDSKNQESKKERFIDPKIKLSKKHLSLIRPTLEKKENPKYKKFIQKIIQIIEKKGLVNSQNIITIFNGLNIENNTELYQGKIFINDDWIGITGFPGVYLLNSWLDISFFGCWNVCNDNMEFTLNIVKNQNIL